MNHREYKAVEIMLSKKASAWRRAQLGERDAARFCGESAWAPKKLEKRWRNSFYEFLSPSSPLLMISICVSRSLFCYSCLLNRFDREIELNNWLWVSLLEFVYLDLRELMLLATSRGAMCLGAMKKDLLRAWVGEIPVSSVIFFLPWSMDK